MITCHVRYEIDPDEIQVGPRPGRVNPGAAPDSLAQSFLRPIVTRYSAST